LLRGSTTCQILRRSCLIATGGTRGLRALAPPGLLDTLT
jgi:hypothetical protein